VKTHIQAIKSLAPEDYQLIEGEHLRLHGLLNNLHNTCCNLDNQLSCQSCGREKMASCQGQLTCFIYNLTYLTDSHFHNEEFIMRHWPYVTEEYENFLKHQNAHADIMDELQKIVSECASLNKSVDVSEGYRQLYKRMSELLKDHDRLFDDPFIQSTKS